MEEAAKLVSGSVLAPSSLWGADEAGTKAMLHIDSAERNGCRVCVGRWTVPVGAVAEARARGGTQRLCRTLWPTSRWAHEGLGAQGKGVEMRLGKAHRADFLEEAVLDLSVDPEGREGPAVVTARSGQGAGELGQGAAQVKVFDRGDSGGISGLITSAWRAGGREWEARGTVIAEESDEN